VHTCCTGRVADMAGAPDLQSRVNIVERENREVCRPLGTRLGSPAGRHRCFTDPSSADHGGLRPDCCAEQLRKKLEQVEREHKDLKRAYFQLSLRQKNEKEGAQVRSANAPPCSRSAALLIRLLVPLRWSDTSFVPRTCFPCPGRPTKRSTTTSSTRTSAMRSSRLAASASRGSVAGAGSRTPDGVVWGKYCAARLPVLP
jgi:hypothetical protein